MHLPNHYSSSSLSSFVTTSCSAKATRFVSPLWDTSGSPRHLHIMLQDTFADEQLHRFVLQGEVDEQPHFIMFYTSYGAREIYSGKQTCKVFKGGAL